MGSPAATTSDISRLNVLDPPRREWTAAEARYLARLQRMAFFILGWHSPGRPFALGYARLLRRFPVSARRPGVLSEVLRIWQRESEICDSLETRRGNPG